VPPRRAEHLAVALDAHDLGVGREHPQRPGDAPPAEAEDEHTGRAIGGEQRHRRRQRPPHGPRQPPARTVQRGERAVDAELEPAATLPHVDPGAGAHSPLRAAAPRISPRLPLRARMRVMGHWRRISSMSSTVLLPAREGGAGAAVPGSAPAYFRAAIAAV